MKVITIVGARPQFIKASIISKEIINSNKINTLKIEEIIIHTGQHYDKNMSANFFSDLNIPHPKYNLAIGGGSHGYNTGNMIIKIEEILLNEKPDYVILYGDTDSTLAGAIAASKINIQILHIEAGLRSYDIYQPEEKNRVITDYLSSMCFAPTQDSVNNLLKENIDKSKIFLCGDIMIDLLFSAKNNLSKAEKLLTKFKIINKSYALATIHREENTNNKTILENILKSFNSSQISIVLPLHPRTRKKIASFGLEDYLSSLIILEPLKYTEMLSLQLNAKIIVTDSGGIQKEAYFNKIPCITLRERTEWIGTLEHGWNIIANPNNFGNISEAIKKQLNFKLDSFHPSLYGDGHSSKSIIKKIREMFKNKFK